MNPTPLQRARRAVAALLGAFGALALPALAQDIVIGQVAPFSGPQAVTGKAMHAGAKLVFGEVNAKGGIRGRKIRFVTRDDGQKPEETIRLLKELIPAEQPVALVGSVGTASLEALAKDGLLVKEKVSMVGAVSGAATVVRASGMHIVKASYHDEVGRLFSQLARLGIQRVGLVYQDDGLGRDVLAGADAAAAQHGIRLVVRSGYPRNTVQVEKAVAEILKSDVQVVFLGATTAAGIEFVRQYAAGGGRATLYGLSIIDTDALVKALGPEKSRGYAFSVVVPLASRANVPVVRDFQRLREAANDPALTARSIEGFIAARAIVRTLEGLASPSAAAFTTAINAARNVDVGGYVLDFADDGRAASRFVDFAMIGSNGRIVQ